MPKVEVTLYNPATGERTRSVYQPQPLKSPDFRKDHNSAKARKRHQDASFAAMRDIEIWLRDARIPTGHAWEFIKAEYDVSSRSEFTTEQWAVISARLNACRRDKAMMYHFVASVREFKASQTLTPQQQRRAYWERMPF